MIEFIEKQRTIDKDPFVGGAFIPTYFKKDGKEYFAFNRYVTEDSYRTEQYSRWEKELIQTDGAYLRYHSFYESPLDMLAEMAERQHHFVNPEGVIQEDDPDGGYCYFGNREEVSAAFEYRIYDAELQRQIREITALLIREEWGAAQEAITQARGGEKP